MNRAKVLFAIVVVFTISISAGALDCHPFIINVNPEFVPGNYTGDFIITGLCLDASKVTFNDQLIKATGSPTRLKVTLQPAQLGSHSFVVGDSQPFDIVIDDSECVLPQTFYVPLDLTPPGGGADQQCRTSASGKTVVIDANDQGWNFYKHGFARTEFKCGSRRNGPLYLGMSDDVTLILCNKNPFTKSYKLTINQAKIQEDDIGQFLNILVPAIGASQAANTTQQAAKTAKDNITSSSGQHMAFRLPGGFPSCTKIIHDRIVRLEQDYSRFVQAYTVMRAGLYSETHCDGLVATAGDIWQVLSEQLAGIQQPQLDMAVQDQLTHIASLEASVDEQTKKSLELEKAEVQTYGCISQAFHKGVAGALSDLVGKLEGTLSRGNSFISKNMIGSPPDPAQLNWELTSGSPSDITNVLLSSTDTSQPIQSCVTGLQSQSAAPKPGTPSQQNPSNSTPNDHSNPNPASDKDDDSKPEPTPRKKNSKPLAQSASLKLERPVSDDFLGQSLARMIYVSLSVGHDSTLANSNESQKTGKDDRTKTGSAQNKGQQQTQKQNQSQDESKDQNQAQDQSQSQNQSQSNNQDQSDVSSRLASGTIYQGQPRFIVSAGASLVFLLPKVEFQKSIGQALDAKGNPITGKETANIIDFKTNSSFRISPLIMLNTRLPLSYNDHSLYFTVGVTGKPDNQGIDPEYLFGLSWSTNNNHVFWTAGGYLGEKQKLSGSLFVHEEVPSSLTGDIPVQKNYHLGFALSVSYRIPKLAK